MTQRSIPLWLYFVLSVLWPLELQRSRYTYLGVLVLVWIEKLQVSILFSFRHCCYAHVCARLGVRVHLFYVTGSMMKEREGIEGEEK